MNQRDKLPLGLLFRHKREEKGLLVRQVAAVLETDQALISRIENCERLPTKEQVLKLAGLYNMDLKQVYSAWLAERMIRDYGDEPFVQDAFNELADNILEHTTKQKNHIMNMNRIEEEYYRYASNPKPEPVRKIKQKGDGQAPD